MKRILFFAILFFPLLAFSQTRQDSVGVKAISSLTELTANIDTSYEVIFHDPSTGKISYRASVGEFLKTINALPSVIGTSQIINATIINEDISGSAAIALSKLQNLTANRLVGRDTTGTGIPESLTVGYGLRMGTDRIDIDTVSASGLVSKSRLTNSLDDVSATGGIWEQENTSTIATANTTDNYHEGNIGIGDFSATTIGATIHAYDVTNVRLRLSDSAANDTVAQAYIEYYRGYATNKLGQIGYTDNTDLDLHIENHLTSGGIEFRTDNIEKMKLFADGQLSLSYYGDTLYTGTAVKYLAVTDDGLVIEADAGASVTAGTPTSNSEGSAGDLQYDNNYLYVKNAVGWNRIALEQVLFSNINVDTMPNLYQWLVADSLVLSDGGAITTFTDESGNGNSFSQSTASNKPTYRTNQINGHAIADFDGNDYMEIADLDFSADSVEVFVVVNFNSSSGSPVAIGAKKDSSTIKLNVIDSLTATSYSYAYIDTTGAGDVFLPSTSVYTPNEYKIHNFHYDQAQFEYIINGTTQGTTALTATINNVVAKFYLGAFFEPGVGIRGNLNGQIAEVIIFSAKLSVARRTQVKNYLAEKYNITVN